MRQPRQVTELNAELSDVVDGNSAFAWSMYDQLRGEQGNLFFSPFSISAALGMTYAGAAGATADQMASTLHVADPSDFHASFGSLIRDLDGDKGRGYDLYIANQLFGQDGYPFESTFLDLTNQDYGAELELVDFQGATEPSRKRINEWVAEKTRDKIPELLPQGILDSSTRLVLANAVYFKADWAEQFDEEDTSNRPFTLRDGTQVQVPTMSHKGDYRAYYSANLQAVELDYLDDEVAMLIVMPSGEGTFEEVEGTLLQDGFGPIVAGLHSSELFIQMPKFEFRDKTDLKPRLEALGIVDAFEPTMADFSGIAPTDLYLTAVVHEAYVKVDEQGTEAAAATAVSASDSGPSSISVNRPFVFAIRDRLTGSILFLGRVDDPRAS